MPSPLRVFPLVLALSALLLALPCAADNPSVLILSPQGAAYGWVDLGYLQELHAQGFELDYTESLRELTWDRLQQYNVLLVYTLPAPRDEQHPVFGSPPEGPFREESIELLERFLQQGGGVFLMIQETHLGISITRPLLHRLGADLPVETLDDPTNSAPMSHMPLTLLAWTDQISPSPISDGVRGLWYPPQHRYNGGFTLPLVVDEQWQVVVRAMPECRTVPVDLASVSTPFPADSLQRPGGVTAPPLIALREWGPGRVVFMSQWPQFSIGQGTKWLYDREMLSRGLQGRPSDFGRLLENSFRWLAEPSLASATLGGYVTPEDRLTPPNRRPSAKTALEEWMWSEEEENLHRPPMPGQLFRGLIGAQTALSGGQGTVAEYAQAAREAGLQFVIFLEDFTALDATKYDRLKAACLEYSDEEITLYPGYRLETNVGNRMFICGPGTSLPPDRCLVGPDKKIFMEQFQNEEGEFVMGPPTLDWKYSQGGMETGQVGYYDFGYQEHGLRLEDLRVYSMAAIRLYRDGELVEDVTDAYLTTAAATLPPSPVALNLVSSPDELRREVAAGHSLTYAMARSRATLWRDGLRWNGPYDGLNIFLSDGPLIQQWPGCWRVITYGAEPFVSGRSLMRSPIHVTSERGLREIRIYDGDTLFRRFRLNGEKVFQRTLYLPGTVYRTMNLIAEDVEGGRALSHTRRCYKEGAVAPVFCNDHVNDCGFMFLARGPYPMTVQRSPELPDPGFTWDGGPKGTLTPVAFEGSSPCIWSDHGMEDGWRHNQTPYLETSDEGAVSVRSVHEGIIDKRVPAVNPWHTYGPLADSEQMDFTVGYVEWIQPIVDVVPTGWAGPGVLAGCNASLFRQQVRFKRDLQLEQLRLIRNWHWIPGLPMRVAIGQGGEVQEIDPATVTAAQAFLLQPGDWFACYSPQPCTAKLFLNRGAPVELRLYPLGGGEWLSLYDPERNAPVREGEERDYEIFGVGYPLNVPAHETQAFLDTLAYLAQPEGLEILRGARQESFGPLQISVENYALEVQVPRPSRSNQLTLPVLATGLNPRWAAGLWQIDGFVKGSYGPSQNRYRAVAVDPQGRAYVPLYPDWADLHHVVVGHPLAADERGRDLFIQVTALAGGCLPHPEFKWYADINNPTDRPLTTVLTQQMPLPNFDFGTRELTLAPGEHRVLYRGGAALPAS